MSDLSPRRLAWIAVGLAGLPGAVFGALAVVIGGFFAIVALIAFLLARFHALDHAVAALLAIYFAVWLGDSLLADSSDWFGAFLVLTVFCMALAMSKLGRMAGCRVWGRV